MSVANSLGNGHLWGETPSGCLVWIVNRQSSIVNREWGVRGKRGRFIAKVFVSGEWSVVSGFLQFGMPDYILLTGS